MKRNEMLRIIGEVLDRLETEPQRGCMWWDNGNTVNSSGGATNTNPNTNTSGCPSDAVVMKYAAPVCTADAPVIRYQAPCPDTPTVRYAVLD